MIHAGSRDKLPEYNSQTEEAMEFDPSLAYQTEIDATADLQWKKELGTEEVTNEVCVTTLREKEMQTANLAKSRVIESHDFAYAEEVPADR